MEKSSNSLVWLAKFGITLTQLDAETQKLVRDLGESGVKRLVEENKGKVYHRGERLSPDEALQEAEKISRTFSTSDNDPIFVGKGSRKAKSKPIKWKLDELRELLDDRLG